MNKCEKKVIQKARDEMDENTVSQASFKIQSILEELYQKGIEVGETIGYAKAVMEHADLNTLEKQIDVDSKTKKTTKGCKK